MHFNKENNKDEKQRKLSQGKISFINNDDNNDVSLKSRFVDKIFPSKYGGLMMGKPWIWWLSH